MIKYEQIMPYAYSCLLLISAVQIVVDIYNTPGDYKSRTELINMISVTTI